MIPTVIVEDEKNAFDLLKTILTGYCPEIHIVGNASNLKEGLTLINEQKPELVFLDIQLGSETGFELLDKLETKEFKLVITSAYDHYALEGFKYHAIDYILKPYSPSVVKEAVDRVKQLTTDQHLYKKLSALISPKPQQSEQERITISTNDGLHVIEMKDIVRLEAQQSYSEIILADSKNILVSKSLSELQNQLPCHKFYRVHNGHLVNMACVKQISNQDGGYLIMTDGSHVPLARRRKQDFLAALRA